MNYRDRQRPPAPGRPGNDPGNSYQCPVGHVTIQRLGMLSGYCGACDDWPTLDLKEIGSELGEYASVITMSAARFTSSYDQVSANVLRNEIKIAVRLLDAARVRVEREMAIRGLPRLDKG